MYKYIQSTYTCFCVYPHSTKLMWSRQEPRASDLPGNPTFGTSRGCQNRPLVVSVWRSWRKLRTSYCAIQNYTMLYYTILYYTILYYTTLHYTIVYYTTFYYAILTVLRYIMLYCTLCRPGHPCKTPGSPRCKSWNTPVHLK